MSLSSKSSFHKLGELNHVPSFMLILQFSHLNASKTSPLSLQWKIIPICIANKEQIIFTMKPSGVQHFNASHNWLQPSLIIDGILFTVKIPQLQSCKYFIATF